MLNRACIYRSVRLLFITIFLGIGISDHALAQDCSFRVGWSEFPPFQTTGETDEPFGLDMDILRLALEETDCHIESYRKAPWSRILKEIENGRIDVTVSANFTEDRNRFAHFSVPYRAVRFAAFVSSSYHLTGPIVSIEDLVSAKSILGVIQDAYLPVSIMQFVEEARRSHRTITSDNHKMLFNLLKRKRISMFFSEISDATLSVAQMVSNRDVNVLEIEGISDDIHLIFSRATVSQETVDRIDDALRSVISSTEYNAAFQHYMAE